MCMHSHGWIGTLRDFGLFFGDVLTISIPQCKVSYSFPFSPEFSMANLLFFNGNLSNCSILNVPIIMAVQIDLRDTQTMD